MIQRIFPNVCKYRHRTMSCMIATALAFTGAAPAHEHEEKQELGFKTELVTDNIYMLSGVGGFTGGNIGLTIGDDGVAMIDNGLSSVLELLRKEVAKTTDKPIDYLINTHVHGDHIGNNEAYGAADTRIISHRNLRSSLKKNGIGGRNEKLVPAPKDHLPSITFSDQMTLHVNGDAALIKHFSNAHTDGDAVVVFENANVIHTGDIMFNGMFPFIDHSNGGSLQGMIAAMVAIHDMADDNTKIIPGHGPLANKKDVASTVTMLNAAKASVEKLIEAGKSDDEILAADPLKPYASFSWNFITSETMTKQVIGSLRK